MVLLQAAPISLCYYIVINYTAEVKEYIVLLLWSLWSWLREVPREFLGFPDENQTTTS